MCTRTLATESALSFRPVATGDSLTCHVAQRRLSGIDGVVDAYEVHKPVGDKSDGVWVSYVSIRYGRAIIRILIVDFLRPVGDKELDVVVDAVMTRTRSELD